MIWSKHDFEREVRRQLVELASIRKRVSENPEILERIGKLEASHKHLLKKLSDIFPKSALGQSEGVKRSRRTPNVSSLLSRYLRTVESTAAALERAQKGTKQSSMVPAAQGGVKKKCQGELPSLGVKCPACGKVLLSSLLGGEELVYRGESWYHKHCAGNGDSFSKKSMLN